ncbi:MAG: PAS domain S-box protein [Candidatus Hydrogenedentes bacterium]|nr:PAS domain S-box protein [Candidatus Hydrogenedentota bacterium]
MSDLEARREQGKSKRRTAKTDATSESRLINILRTLRDVKHIIMRETDRSVLLSRACEVFTDSRGYRYAWILASDEAGHLLSASVSDAGVSFDALRERLLRGQWPACARMALASRDVVALYDPTTECGECPLSGSYHELAVLAAALRYEEHDYGVLTVAVPRSAADDDGERALIAEVADDLAFALHALDLEVQGDTAKAREAHIKQVLLAIRNVNQLITHEENPQRLITLACENLTATLGYFNAWIALLEEDARAISAVAAAGLDGQFGALRERLMRGEFSSCMRRALEQDATIVINDPITECTDCPLSREYGGRSGLVRRLAAGGKTYGILAVSVPTEFVHDSEERSLFEKMAGDLAFALDKIRVRRRLSESEDLTQKYFEHAPLGVFVADRSGRYVDVNLAAERITGFSAQQLLSMSITDMLPPEGQEAGRAHFQRLLDTGHSVGETAFRRANGDIGWWRVSASLLNENLFMGFVEDLTDQQRQDERIALLARMIDDAPAAVTIHGTDGRFLFVNREALLLHGYEREDEFLAISLFDLDVPESVALLERRFREIEERGEVRFEAAHYRKDRSILPLDIVAKRILWRGTPVILSIATDITERKRAGQVLRESEERLSLALRATNDVVWDWDIIHDTQRWNESGARVFGWTDIVEAPQTVGWWLDRLHPEDRKRVDETFFAALQDRGVDRWNDEYRFRRADGEYAYVVDRGYILRDADGRAVRMIGAMLDITERKRVEGQLRLQSLVLDQIQDRVTVTDLNGVITYINNAEVRALGYSRDELIGVSTEKYGEDPERGATQRQIFEETLEHGEWRGEVVNQTADGKEVILDCRTQVVLDEQGNKVALAGIATDITERKRMEDSLRDSEAHLRFLVDHSFDLIWTKRADGVFTYISPSWKTRLGYEPSDLLGKTFRPFVHPDDVCLCEEYMSRVLDARSALPGPQYRVRHANGSWRWHEAHMTPTYAEDGSFMTFVGVSRDISERRLAELALSRSEALLNASQRLARIGGWEWNVSEQTMKWTDEAYRIHDLEPGDIAEGSDEHIAKSLQCYDEQDRPAVLAAFRECVEQGRPYDMDVPFTTFKGRRLWIRTSGHAVMQEGKVQRVVGVIMDITDRKRVEDALWQSREILRAVLDNIPARVFWKDKHLNYLGCNLAFARDAGFEAPEQLIGKNDFGLSWREQAERYRSDDRAVLQEGIPRLLVEEPQTTPSGGTIHLLTSKVPLRNAQGAVIGVLGTYMDITERKRAEEERTLLATGLEQTAEAVIITTVAGDITYVNPAFERITGYQRHEAIGQSPRILKSGERDETFYRELWQCITSGNTWSGRMRNRRKNGTLYDAELTISPVMDATRTVVSFVAIQRDITDQLALERRFRQSQKMEAIGTLAGGIAHDFNNILAAIIGYVQLIDDTLPEGSESKADMGRLMEAVKRATDLVQQILTVSRQAEERRQVIDLDLIVKEAIKLLRPSLPSTIEIRIEVGKQRFAVLADPTQIHQVIMNLCTNAYYAMKNSGGCLTVSLRALTPDPDFFELHPGVLNRDYMQLSISDTGCGIPDEHLDRIFDPFFTTKPLGEGTGLGLSTVHGLVTSLGGAIAVNSEVGKGTSFVVYLPLTTAETASETQVKGAVTGGTERILVIDDEPALISILTRALRKLGYEVTGMVSPVDALQAFSADPNRFDLIITDQTMPKLTGLQMAAEVKRIRPDIPIIVTTGQMSSFLQERRTEAQVSAVLPKPARFEDIARTVRMVLDPRSTWAESIVDFQATRRMSLLAGTCLDSHLRSSAPSEDNPLLWLQLRRTVKSVEGVLISAFLCELRAIALM